MRIGPGRYDAFTLRTLGAGGTLQIVGLVSRPNLVIEGVDRNTVRIGRASQTNEIDSIHTIGISVDLQATDVTIRNLTAEHTFAGVGTTADRTTWESVSVIAGGQTGLQSWATDGLIIRNCFFTGATSEGVWLVAQAPSRNTLIEGCTVEATGELGIYIGTAQNVTVRNCSFQTLGSSTASIQFWNGAQGAIENCTFTGTGAVHVATGINTDVRMDNNVCGAGASLSLSVVSGRVHGTGNFFGGGTFTTIEILGQGSATNLQNGTIEHLAEYSVRAITELGSKTDVISLRNNYWGTTDSTQIAEWILDGNDAPEGSPLAPVLFTPFRDQRVATEKSSFGSVKALFADPR